jgi:hypothetical protein
MAAKQSDGNFSFESEVILPVTFSELNLLPETSNHQCLTASFNSDTDQLDLTQTDCEEEHTVICRKALFKKPDCSSSTPFTQRKIIEVMLAPEFKLTNKQAVAHKKAEVKEMIGRLDLIAAFPHIFSTLWYSSLPCFDIRNITIHRDGGSSVLKYCEWKGIAMSCSSIFTTFPTDRGMCCSFNMKAANDIFVENAYTTILKEMQAKDKIASSHSSSVPSWYVESNEPKTIPGKNKGLVLMLDANSNLLSTGSIDSDFRGFTVFVGTSGSFPLMSQEGIEVRPGYTNIITLTSSKIDANEDMKSLQPSVRNCYFPDENTNLRVHKEYSYLNCKLECSLSFTQDQVFQKYNRSCQPWYFPTFNDSITMCNPWESFDFFSILNNDIPDDWCSGCLPDCGKTTYEPTVNSLPFDRCDYSNLGVSRFCSFNQKRPLPMTEKFATQVQNEYLLPTGTVFGPYYIHRLESSMRDLGQSQYYDQLFKSTPRRYDSFDKDISMVKIIYQESTVVLIGSETRMTWIDYLATVGGLLGLVLGMGFISFVELVWLLLRIISKWMNLTDWIA